MKPCDGCSQGKATRIIQIETYPGSGRAVERNTCEDCYDTLGQPETIAYICRDCGKASNRPDVCPACADRRRHGQNEGSPAL
jgi:rubrerythrin